MPPKSKFSTEKDLFLARCHHFQWVLLFINIAVITVGSCDLGLAFASRPLLRLIDLDYASEVASICNLMVASAFIQISTAGLDILTTCSKRIRYLYISITVSILAVLVEIAAIIAALYLLSQGSLILSLDVVRAWFIWDCLPYGSCENGLAYYVNSFMMPQVGITALAIILHGLSILYLLKLFRAKRLHMDELWRAKERYRKSELNEDEDKAGFKENFAEANSNESFSDAEEVRESDENHLLEIKEKIKPPRSPISILKDSTSEHGYVASDAVDADIDGDGSQLRSRQKLKESHVSHFDYAPKRGIVLDDVEIELSPEMFTPENENRKK